jgi:hypothetical protein
MGVFPIRTYVPRFCSGAVTVPDTVFTVLPVTNVYVLPETEYKAIEAGGTELGNDDGEYVTANVADGEKVVPAGP